jgi:hypothetical protein
MLMNVYKMAAKNLNVYGGSGSGVCVCDSVCVNAKRDTETAKKALIVACNLCRLANLLDLWKHFS